MDRQPVATSEPIGADQRLFERFPANCLARYKNATDYQEGEFFLRDASAQGLSCVTRDPLYANDILWVDVNIPGSPDPLRVQGEVVWLKQDEENLWDVGLKLQNARLVDMSRLYPRA